MKKINYLTLFVAIIFQVCISFSPASAEKYALIIGISHYKAFWQDISSDEDVLLVKNALKRQGFKDENIRIMTDSQCTRDAILKAINDNLTARVKPGDVAVFHFSGHGQRIFDSINHQQDGYDQSLVCYDAPDHFLAGETDDKHLRGADLGKALMQLREKLGATGNLLVVLDACHSGNGVRGGGKKRGVEYPFEPKGYNPAKITTNVPIPQGFGLTDDNKNNSLANMVCFYACSPHQCNSEFSFDSAGTEIDCGSLSYAFSKELILADPSTSYSALWNNIRADMAVEVSQQTPQKEGNLDCKILGGNALPRANYFSVNSFDKNAFLTETDKTLWINCGKIYGINTGTTVAFYPPDTRDTNGVKSLCTARVTDLRLDSCQVTIDNTTLSRGINPQRIVQGWVYLKNISYGLIISIKLPVDNTSLNKNLQTILSNPDFSFVRINKGTSDIYLDYSGSNEPTGGKLLFSAEGGIRCDSIMNWDGKTDNLKRILLNLAKWKFTKEDLVMSNPNDTFQVKMLPLEYSYGSDKNPHITRFLDTISGKIELHTNDKDGFILEFTNNTDHNLYINVLDIEPDGKVNLTIPDLQTDVICILPHRRYLTKMIGNITPPYGTEIIKLICSSTFFDLSSVFDPVKRAARGISSPFGMLYDDVITNKTRGGGHSLPSASDEVEVKSIEYTIAPPVSMKQ